MSTLAALAALVALGTSLAAQDSGIPIGSVGPGAVVETLDGRPADLASVLGTRPVLIEFWATWCGNCQQLEPALMAARAKYSDRVTFVGVAVSVNQSPESVRRYVTRHLGGFTHFYDRRGNAVDAYDVPATSYVVILDASGKVVYTGVGGDQNIDAALARALTVTR